MTTVGWRPRRSRYTGDLLDRRTTVGLESAPVRLVAEKVPGGYALHVYRGTVVKAPEGHHHFATLALLKEWVQIIVDETAGRDPSPRLVMGPRS